MNVIVSNVNADKFNNLDVDVIKSINGEFSVDEIVQSFSNFFFNRMFLDITSVQNYQDVNTLKKLSVGLDVSKIILLLSDDAVVNTDNYISNLISVGIYNFAHTEDELKYLYENPNSYKDVAHLQMVKEPSNFINPDLKKTEVVENDSINKNGARIIGFKNLTDHAGATSLIYMLKKQLSQNYYTVAIEINKKDFMFFNDNDMISCVFNEIRDVMQNYQNANVILVDLNDIDLSLCHSICEDVIFLMESSTLKVNKLVMLDNKCFDKVHGEKVVLNQSLLFDMDIKRLQQEAGITFFNVLPPLDDRVDNSKALFPFLEKLGLYKRVGM